jgi:hypothetical protein
MSRGFRVSFTFAPETILQKRPLHLYHDTSNRIAKALGFPLQLRGMRDRDKLVHLHVAKLEEQR